MTNSLGCAEQSTSATLPAWVLGLVSPDHDRVASLFPLDVDRLLDVRLSSPCTGAPCFVGLYEQNSAGLSPQVEETIATLVALGVTIDSTKELRAFLLDNPDLFTPMRHSCAEAMRHWQASVKVHVAVVNDPETSLEYVAVYVRAPSYSDDFLDDLQRLAERTDALIAWQPDRFLISTDFQLPPA